ncbi:MAG: hypothetical protein ACI9DF_005734 [Verrucomicrobiales bacterium]|jgi:hypothetical protein
MRYATTIFLAIAALALAGYAFLDFTGKLDGFFKEKAPPELLAPVAEAITGLTFKDVSETRVLEKREGRWRLTSPVDDLVDPKWVEGVLETLSAMHKNEFIRDTDGGMREGFGLNEDKMTALTVQLSDGKTILYQIGQTGPYENSTYLFPGESGAYEGAFIAAGEFKSAVETPVSGMVDPVLTRFAAERIVGLTLKGQDPVVELKKNASAGSRWRLEAPIQQQADDDKVSTLLTTLGALPVSDVVLDVSNAETTAGGWGIEIWDMDPQNVIELTFSPHPTDETLLRARHSKRPLLYDVPKQIIDDLPSEVESLRETKLLRVVAADISSVSITRQGGVPLKLNNPGVWMMAGPDGDVLTNPEHGERFIALFNDAVVGQYLEGGPEKEELYGLNNAMFTIEMTGENLGPLQQDTLVMRVGMPLNDPPNAYVVFDQIPTIMAVPKTFLTGMADISEPRRWKKLEVLNVAFELIEEITMAPAGEPPLRLLVDRLNEDIAKRLLLFKGEDDLTADTDKKGAGEIILDVGNLSADRWLSTTEPESAIALVAPTLTLILKSRPVTKDGEGKTWTLKFAPVNAEVPSFYYGQMEGTDRPAPFLIGRALYDRLAGKGLLLEAP